MLRIGTDRGAEIEHHRFAAHRRPQRRQRRAIDLRHRVQADFRHRHQRAGIASRDGDIRLAALHRVDRHPHGRDAPAAAQRLAWLVIHPHGHRRVDQLRMGGQFRLLGEQRRDLRFVAINEEFGIRSALMRQSRAFDDDRGSVIATHTVQRNPDRFRHPVNAPALHDQTGGPNSGADNSRLHREGNPEAIRASTRNLTVFFHSARS